MRFLVLMISLACFTGCASLEGDWSGEMACRNAEGEVADWGADFTVEKNEYEETVFLGTVTEALPCTADGDDQINCDFVMEGYLHPSKPSGKQRIDVDVDRCVADGGLRGSTGFGCEDPTWAQWDGRNEFKIGSSDAPITVGDDSCFIVLER
jgi:hypothetical protein